MALAVPYGIMRTVWYGTVRYRRDTGNKVRYRYKGTVPHRSAWTDIGTAPYRVVPRTVPYIRTANYTAGTLRTSTRKILICKAIL